MAGSGSSAISQARIEVLDETGARETKSRGVLNERALGIGRLIFGWHLPFHVAQIRDARALDGTEIAERLGIDEKTLRKAQVLPSIATACAPLGLVSRSSRSRPLFERHGT